MLQDRGALSNTKFLCMAEVPVFGIFDIAVAQQTCQKNTDHIINLQQEHKPHRGQNFGHSGAEYRTITGHGVGP